MKTATVISTTLWTPTSTIRLPQIFTYSCYANGLFEVEL